MTVIDVDGPSFEDLPTGFEYDAPAVTLTAGHAALQQALTGDRLRLPLDHATSAAVTGQAAPLAHPLLVINVVMGQTTWASQRVKGNLFYRGLQLPHAVHLGDTLYTRTRVVARRRSRAQPGRAPTGLVVLEIRTVNQREETVLHGWRCPMLLARGEGAAGEVQDNLDAVGHTLSTQEVVALVPGWDLAKLRRAPAAAEVAVGTRYRIAARDTVTCAPELARLTLNMAMAHTDAGQSYLGERLVYGGHTVGIAFAQVTRALPDLVTVLGWEACDHLAPVLEGDVLRTEVEVLESTPLPQGKLLKLRAETWATRAAGGDEVRVLDWRFHAWGA